MTEDKLKPCPFCGAEVKVNYNIGSEPDGVYCISCKAFVKWSNIGEMKGKETIAEHAAKIIGAWNRRADDGK